MVDTGFPPVELIKNELIELGVNNAKYIINTHSNGDHILGNSKLGNDAAIISSVECRKDILKRENFPKTGLPTITFDDSLTLRFNNEIVKLYFLPGHTGNDIVIFFENAKIVCLGDLIFPDSFPGVQTVRGGNVYNLEKSLNKILQLFPKKTKFILGHGRNYNYNEVAEYYEMTQKTIGIVTSEIRKGKTLEEIKKDKPLEDWKNWDSRYFPSEITANSWIENIFESYYNLNK